MGLAAVAAIPGEEVVGPRRRSNDPERYQAREGPGFQFLQGLGAEGHDVGPVGRQVAGRESQLQLGRNTLVRRQVGKGPILPVCVQPRLQDLNPPLPFLRQPFP